MNLLSEDVTLWADGGGKIKQAALRPIRERDAVARFSLGNTVLLSLILYFLYYRIDAVITVI